MSLNHPILFGSAKENLKHFLSERNYINIIIFCDTNTAKHCVPVLQLNDKLPVITMPAGEVNKTISTCETVWQQLLQLGADRKSLLINIGGGVVTDLGGFAASCYKRGVHFVNIPTSLLAMVDASTGGKTGVNFNHIKNSIGAFSIPEVVLIDDHFLDTLPKRHIKNGISEIIKHGLIADKTHLTELDTAIQNNQWQQVIQKSIAIKQNVVENDPYEQGLRKTLNFGHTIGHAIESYCLDQTDTPLLHGEAIALGMIAEAWLSTIYCGLSNREFKQIQTLIYSIFNRRSFNTTAQQAMLNLMKNDKKNQGNSIRMSLIETIGNATFNIEVSQQNCLNSLNILTE